MTHREQIIQTDRRTGQPTAIIVVTHDDKTAREYYVDGKRITLEDYCRNYANIGHVDWEQRRYKIAAEIMATNVNWNCSLSDSAHSAVEAADCLIDMLRRPTNKTIDQYPPIHEENKP